MFVNYVRHLNSTRGGPANPETPYLSYWAVLLNKVWNDTFNFGTSSYGTCFEYYDTLSYVLSYTYYFGNVLWNETLYRLSIRLFCIMKWLMGLLCFERLFWSMICICLLTTPLVPYYDFVHRFPGRFWFVRGMINSAVCCVTVPEASP